VKKNLCVAAWLMAGKTMVLKDANDLFVEADFGSDRFVRAGFSNHDKAQKTQNQEKSI